MLKFDTNRVMNSEKNILDAKKALQNAKSSIDGIKIPNDFIYASSLKSISISIEDINEQINSIKNWIKDKADRFTNISKKGINIIQLAIMGFTTESELVPDYEAIDFLNSYIDPKKYFGGRNKIHSSINDLMTDVVGEIDANKFINAKNEENWIIENNSFVNQNISKYLYDEYAIKASKSDITKVIWGKREIEIFLNNKTEINIANGNENLTIKIYNNNNALLLNTGIGDGIDYVNIKTNTYVDASEYYKGAVNQIPKVYKINEKSKEKIREKYDIKDNYDIAGGTLVNINGRNTVVYWISSDKDRNLINFIYNVNTIEEQMKKYPSNAIDRVYKDGNFSAFLVGPTAAHDSDIRHGNWGGLAHLNKYIYMNELVYDIEDNKSIVRHEFTHVLDNTIGRDMYLNHNTTDKEIDVYFSDYDPKLDQLFKDNRQKIQTISDLKCNGYCMSEQFPDGIPNKKEFLTTLTELYLTQPDDLKELPECYEYMDEFFENM